MKKLLYLSLLLFAVACDSNPQQCTQIDDDTLAQYRDTLIGRFNGMDIDTLICEPIDSLSPMTDEWFGGKHFKWRVYTTNGTVKDLIIGNTKRIDFIKEGDLDGNGTDELGVFTDWHSSNWCGFYVYTFTDGEWKQLIPTIDIHRDHYKDSLNNGVNVVERPEHKGYLNVHFSGIRNEQICLIDTLIRINQ